MSTNDPSKLVGDPDEAVAALQTPARTARFDRDATAEEAAALAPFAKVIDLAARARAHLERPDVQHNQRVTERSLARFGRSKRELESHATKCGVPLDPGVRAIALQDVPPTLDAVAFVQRALTARAEQTERGGRRVPLVVVLIGTPGTGKTCAGAWAVVHHPEPAQYLTASDVAAWARNGHSESNRVWDARLVPDLLVIDELGRETNTLPVIEMALDRHALARATILSGNITLEQFRERYTDARLRSRMARQKAEGAPGLLVLTGRDMRLGGGQ